MDELKPEPLLDGLVFPKGPRWRDGRLWFSDMRAERVMAVDLSGQAETIVEVPGMPSGLGWLPDGRLLIVSMRDRRILRLDPGGLAVHADLSPFARGDANDMVVDGHGRAYVGNFGFSFEEEASAVPTRLLLVTPDGQVRPVGEDLMFPNGTTISPDGRTLIVAETFANQLSAMDIEPDGSLGGRRTFAHIRTPDGICLDAEGGVWVASIAGRAFVRLLEGSQATGRVAVAPRRAYGCMLGGEDRRTLFLLTGEGGQAGIQDSRATGSIDTVRVDVPGAGWP